MAGWCHQMQIRRARAINNRFGHGFSHVRDAQRRNRRIATMIEYLKAWLELKTDRRAVTALEYGVIAGILAVVVVTSFNTLGNGLNRAFNHVGSQL
jgi:pilus assembly protein Flp/PilA